MTIFPRDITVDLAVAGYWTDIRGYVRQGDGITITRGRAEGASQSQPTRATLTLDNTDGRFIRANPTGPYYGGFGRNTPLRVGVRAITDTFARTVTDGWGSNTPSTSVATYAYSTAGSGGSVLASDWNVGSGVGTQSVPTTTAYRLAYLGEDRADVEIAATCSVLPFVTVTGAPIEPLNLILRYQTSGALSGQHYLLRVEIRTDNTVWLSIHHSTAGELITPISMTVLTGLTHVGDNQLRARFQAEGDTLRGKVWDAADSEPDGWHAIVNDTRLPSGVCGVRSGIPASNTNTKPVVFSYDDLEVVHPRFVGEVAEWPATRSDPSDATVQVEASGVTRRLGQGSSAERSLLYKAITTQSNAPVAYWPCEDGDTATSFASGIGGPPMSYSDVPNLATYTGFKASDPLPTLGTSSWAGSVPTYTPTNDTQVRFLMHVPAAGGTDGARIIVFETTGTVRYWGLYYTTGGGLRFTANSSTGPEVLNSGAMGFSVNDEITRVSIELEQSGSDVSWSISTIDVAGNAGGVGPFTLSSQTVGIVTGVFMGPNGAVALPADTAFGHITVQAAIDSIFALADELAAYAGEGAGDRVERQAGEEGLRFSSRGSLSATPMGPQRSADRLSVARECEAANLGLFGEPRGDLGLSYVERSALYNQAATIDLDYDNSEMHVRFESVDDDRFTRNDVTVSRVDGSSARVTVDTGPLSTQPPPDGAGRYEDSPSALNVETDAQLPDIAGWKALLGTVNEARYPRIIVNLAHDNTGDRIMDADVGDRITLSNLTDNWIYDQVSQLVLGYTENLSTFEHQISFQCAPESPYQVAEANLSGVKAESGTTTLAEDLTTVETGVDVTVTGPLWTTSGGEMPISITVGGEVMSVTAIAGASSPQTFTVTRSVNGVVKTHATGAEVRLTRRPTTAL